MPAKAVPVDKRSQVAEVAVIFNDVCQVHVCFAALVLGRVVRCARVVWNVYDAIPAVKLRQSYTGTKVELLTQLVGC